MAIPKLFEISEDNELSLRPHVFQERALSSQARITIVLKGWRGGYTSIAPWWLYNTMQACGPGGRALHYLCLTPTIRGARGGLMGTVQSVFCDTLKLGEFIQSPIPKVVINERGEQLLWGHKQREPTEIHFCFAEDPDSFAHYTALAIVADELNQKKFKYESWSVAKARVSTTSGEISKVDGRPKGRILGGSTVYTLNWVEDLWSEFKKAVWEAWKQTQAMCALEPNPRHRALLRADFKRRYRAGILHRDLNFIRFDSTRNPAFNPQEFIDARASSPDWFFQMRYCARFRRPAGMIFDGWDPSRHIIEPFDLPKKWPRIAAIDPGRKNFHATIWAHDEERNRIFGYQDYHDPSKSNQERAQDLLELEPLLSRGIGGNRHSEGFERSELQAGGLTTLEPMYHNLWDGINALNAGMRLNKVFIFRGSCEGFVNQVRMYSRPVDEYGNVQLDKDPEDKESMHWLDGPRYLATWIFSAVMDGGQGVRAATDKNPPRGGSSAEPETPVAVMAALRAGGGMSRDGAYRAQKYGFDEGCWQPHLDI